MRQLKREDLHIGKIYNYMVSKDEIMKFVPVKIELNKYNVMTVHYYDLGQPDEEIASSLKWVLTYWYVE